MRGTHLNDKPINLIDGVSYFVSRVVAHRFSDVIFGLVDFVANNSIANRRASGSKGDHTTFNPLYPV